MESLIPFVGVAAFALVALVIVRLIASDRRRRAERSMEAARQGFRPVVPADPAVVERIIGLHRRAGRTALDVRELERRAESDRTLYLFDLADTSGENTDLVCDRAVLIVAPALRLPRFTLLPQLEQDGMLARMANWVVQNAPGAGGEEVEFPGSPAFQRRYVVMAHDPEGARRFFTAERLAHLAETRYWMVEGQGDALTLDRLPIGPTGRRAGPVHLAERLRDAKRAWEILAGA